MDCASLFESNLALIDRVIAGVCRRARMFGPDAEDFASTVKLSLIENDYAVLRPFEGRSSFSTFLIVVVQRFLYDELTRRSGRWHPSREAERLGEAAVVLERIVRRENRSLDEALPIVQAIDPTLTRARLAEIESRLPVRAPRPRAVGLDDVEDQLAVLDDQAVDRLDRVSDRTARVVRDTLAAMTAEDRMIVRWHYGSSMTVTTIAALLRLPPRPLYRRLESLLDRLRKALHGAGIDGRDAVELIGRTAREMDFGLDDVEIDGARRTNPSMTAGDAEEAG
jgi:RNA polymerase sigma factor (sigma-70 family)